MRHCVELPCSLWPFVASDIFAPGQSFSLGSHWLPAYLNYTLQGDCNSWASCRWKVSWVEVRPSVDIVVFWGPWRLICLSSLSSTRLYIESQQTSIHAQEIQNCAPCTGDHGDRDMRQGLDQCQSRGNNIALVTFGHMHQQLQDAHAPVDRRWTEEKRNMIEISAETGTINLPNPSFQEGPQTWKTTKLAFSSKVAVWHDEVPLWLEVARLLVLFIFS